MMYVLGVLHIKEAQRRRSVMKRLLAVLLALALFSPGVMADIIIFRSGSARKGIIVEETPNSVKLRIRNAVIGFSRDNIERIEYSSASENSKLDQEWKDEEKQKEEKRRQRRAERKRFEKQQADKGLEKVGGQWVSRREKAQIRQKGIEAEMRAQERAEAEEARELERAAVLAEAELARDENRLPEYLKKIIIGKIRIGYSEDENESVLTSRITNSGILVAEVVTLEIKVYDAEGTLLRVYDEEIIEIGPKKHHMFTFTPGLGGNIIDSAEVTVTEVLWE
jgi:hypothetical protein